MAVCFDPNGAAFDVWEPKKSQGTDVDSALHGAPTWFETITTDIERATKFYTGLFGWTPEVIPMPGFEYTTFKLEGAGVAGMMPTTAAIEPVQPHWGTYFRVNDVDLAAQAAVDLGGKVCVPARDIAGIGRFADITSPQGVTFYVIRYAV
jgi:predicted enzyme related to lactoylglutathione lyase